MDPRGRPGGCPGKGLSGPNELPKPHLSPGWTLSLLLGPAWPLSVQLGGMKPTLTTLTPTLLWVWINQQSRGVPVPSSGLLR